MIYTEQSITHTLKVKLKRKKKAHQGNHFSLTIHNYIVSFSVKKTGAHLGVVSCPFLHFHQLASARLEPHVRSAGPTTGNHKGRVNIALVISILHLDGWQVCPNLLPWDSSTDWVQKEGNEEVSCLAFYNSSFWINDFSCFVSVICVQFQVGGPHSG